MPKRRTQDVVRVVMTDHLIRREPAGAELLAPLEEHDPVLVDVQFLDPERAPTGALARVYLAAAVVRAGGGASTAAVDALEQALAATRPPEIEPYLDLGRGQLQQKRFAAAQQTLTAVLERYPNSLLGLEWLAIAQAGLGKPEAAIELLGRAPKRGGGAPEIEFNLGRLLAGLGRQKPAIEHYRAALSARPNQVAAWYHLGNAHAELGELEQAVESYRRALEIDPSHSEAYLKIGQTLLKIGRRPEALRYWRHGAKVAARPQAIAAALEQAASASSSP
jgi:tetratricopeptide (TPR) repeat protein